MLSYEFMANLNRFNFHEIIKLNTSTQKLIAYNANELISHGTIGLCASLKLN